ncbi:i-AAA protease yme1 [Rhodotorula toruloides]
MLPAGHRPTGLLRELLRDFAQASATRRPIPPLRTFSSRQRPQQRHFPRSSSSSLFPFHRRTGVPANLPALAPYSLWSRAVRSAKEASEIDDLRDAISKASSPAEAAEAKLKLFQAIYNLDKKTYAQEVEGLQLYEEVTGLWSDKREPTQVEALKDNEGFLNYLRTLGTLVSSTYKDAPEEEIASNLEKLNTALQRRNSVLGHAPTSATTTATPELTPTLAPTASATPAPAAPSTSTPPVPPAALVSALFSGGSRGKGGEAKIASAGSYGSWSSIFGGASAAKAGSPEPIRVIVEEPKSPLVWRALKFVAVTALYSFLLLSLLSLLIDSSGILRAGGASQPFQPTAPPDPSDPNRRGTTFKDVHGVEEAKAELYEIVEFLKDPKKFEKLGGRLPRGVLLTGPPGTGKTLLARAVAGEAGVPFFSASGSEFDEMYVGVGARRVRELFTAARKNAPAIVFIDELDAVGGKRSPKDQSFHKQTLNQLLTEMDGFSTGEGIILIGATNTPDALDRALVRPGRFDRQVVVPLPDVRGRMEILKHHMKNILYDKQKVDVSIIARGTIGFSGADLQALVNQAAVKASGENADMVRPSHFEWAKERIMMGAARTSAYITPENKLATAYHEAGHALLALYTKGAYPLHSITVIPRGAALGYTLMLPEKDVQSHSLTEYRAKIAVAMGGRVAEELIYGKENVTDGASSDISNATQIASNMVRRFGFSEAIGPVAHMNDSDQPSPSEETQKLIDGEIKGLIEKAQDRAREVLTAKKDELERLARALVEYETLDSAEVQKVIKGEPIRRTGLE